MLRSMSGVSWFGGRHADEHVGAAHRVRERPQRSSAARSAALYGFIFSVRPS